MTESQLSAEGPSFPLSVKLLATVLMAGVLFWGWRVADQIASASMGGGGYGFLLATILVLVCGYWGMLRSRTAISATHISQRWLWNKRVDLAEVTQAKMIHLPYLSWLIAPRLMLKVKGRGLYTFHIADPAVMAIAQRLGLGRPQPF